MAAPVVWDTAAVDPAADFAGVTAVFGYGSLTWKPCCPAADLAGAFPAALPGWHRRFWQASHDHRGTPANPGRVVTVLRADHPDAAACERQDTGGEAVVYGMAYVVKDLARILPELDARERHGYTRTVVHVRRLDTGQLVPAVMYFASPGNDPAYTGPQSDADVAAVLATAAGPSGPNREYFDNLRAWCATHGIVDPHLERLAALLP